MSRPSLPDLPQELRTVRERHPARIVQVRGADWRVRDAGGAGPPLVLLPGSLGNADIFYHQLTGLPHRFRCIAVDYPDADAPDLADMLAALLDAMDLRQAILLGSSLAGYWLQHFGARHPTRTAAVVLANTFCDAKELRGHPLFSVPTLRAIGGEALKAEWLARLEARAPDPLRDVQMELLSVSQSGEQLRKRLLAAAQAPGAPRMAGSIPVAVLDCADDPILSPATRDLVAARYPAARRLTLATGGHYPHVTRHAGFNRFVAEILAP